ASFLSCFQTNFRRSAASVPSCAAHPAGQVAVIRARDFDHGSQHGLGVFQHQLLERQFSQNYRTDAKPISQMPHMRGRACRIVAPRRWPCNALAQVAFKGAPATAVIIANFAPIARRSQGNGATSELQRDERWAPLAAGPAVSLATIWRDLPVFTGA